MKRFFQTMLPVAVLAVAGCGNDDSASGDSAAAASTAGFAKGKAAAAPGQRPAGGAGDRKAPTGSGLKVKAADSQFGKVLFSKGNRAIYYFDKESTRKPECFGACAQAWPPVFTKGRPQAGAGVKSGLLGTTKRSNGRKQATYNGHPLYFYVNDPQGEVGCHNVEEFGGLWLAVEPSGDPVS